MFNTVLHKEYISQEKIKGSDTPINLLIYEQAVLPQPQLLFDALFSVAGEDGFE